MKINDKVKLLKKNEGSNSLVEISRGIVLSIAYGKNTNWVKYLPRETENPDCALLSLTPSNQIYLNSLCPPGGMN